MIGIRDPGLDYGSVPFSSLHIRRRTTSLCAPNCVDEDVSHAIERRSPVTPLTMKKVTIRP